MGNQAYGTNRYLGEGRVVEHDDFDRRHGRVSGFVLQVWCGLCFSGRSCCELVWIRSDDSGYRSADLSFSEECTVYDGGIK